MSFDERADEVRDGDDILDDTNVNPEGDFVQDDEDKEYKFPDEHVQDFNGLMYLGALTDEFDFLGHRITIRTLTTDEILGIGLLLKKYEGSIAQEKAYAAAIVAAAVTSVDGRALPGAIGKSQDEYAPLHIKFNYVRTRWFPWTVDFIFSRFLALEDRVREVFQEMGKAQG